MYTYSSLWTKLKWYLRAADYVWTQNLDVQQKGLNLGAASSKFAHPQLLHRYLLSKFRPGALSKNKAAVTFDSCAQTQDATAMLHRTVVPKLSSSIDIHLIFHPSANQQPLLDFLPPLLPLRWDLKLHRKRRLLGHLLLHHHIGHLLRTPDARQ